MSTDLQRGGGLFFTDAIFKLPLNNASTALQSIRERYDGLLTRSETLPYLFNMRFPPELDLDVVLKCLPKDFFEGPLLGDNEATSAPPEVNRVALLMALVGWQGYTHDKLGPLIDSVSCHACFRILGLWLFKSKEVNEKGEEIKGATMSCLDVVAEHRLYCPWRNALSQNGSTEAKPLLAGWEMILRALKNDHFLKHGMNRNGGRPEFGADAEKENSDVRSVGDSKDKERWARLRRVKSLFDPKRKSQKAAEKRDVSG